jgi:hypothetical protein
MKALIISADNFEDSELLVLPGGKAPAAVRKEPKAPADRPAFMRETMKQIGL